MLPFGVIQIEQYRALQQNAAKLYLPHFPRATKLPPERKLAKPNRQISDRLSDRLSRRDFDNFSEQNMGCLTQKNEAVLAKWAPTSNRQCPTNRSYRKQTTKPCLTDARTHIRLSLNFAKIAQDVAASESPNKDESQKTELQPWNPLWNPLRNPLWKTRRFLQSDLPLLPGLPRVIFAKGSKYKIVFLPGSDQNVETYVTPRKQRTRKFLPGATTAHSRLPNSRKIAQGSDELHN